MSMFLSSCSAACLSGFIMGADFQMERKLLPKDWSILHHQPLWCDDSDAALLANLAGFSPKKILS